jgi:hypothetical protein
MDLIKAVNVEYYNVYCEKSFYLFAKYNSLRRALYQMVTSTKFEGVVLVLIIFSSLKLVVDTYVVEMDQDN